MSDIEQDKFKYEFGIRLEAARIALDISPNDMCELLGCARSTYTQYIRGYSVVAPQKLEPLVIKGITSDYLFFGNKGGVPRDLAMLLDETEREAAVAREKPENRGRRP